MLEFFQPSAGQCPLLLVGDLRDIRCEFITQIRAAVECSTTRRPVVEQTGRTDGEEHMYANPHSRRSACPWKRRSYTLLILLVSWHAPRKRTAPSQQHHCIKISGLAHLET